jgi:hypothetical protein
MTPLHLRPLLSLLLLVLLLPAAVQPRGSEAEPKASGKAMRFKHIMQDLASSTVEGITPVRGGALGTLQRMVAVEEQELDRLEKVVATHRVLIPGSSSMRFSVPAKILSTAAPKACPAPCQKAWYVRVRVGVWVGTERACERRLRHPARAHL